MLLSSLREPGTGRPSPLAKLLAVLVVAGMLASISPVLVPVLRWFAAPF
ncbi:hypothetical protein [Quadrisphaera sp. DSM 44207]|nr:hypothetical protein [Quadrisphaera sp. DSM 44207]